MEPSVSKEAEPQGEQPIPETTIPCKIIMYSEELPTSSKQWTRAKRCDLVINSEGLHFDGITTPFDQLKSSKLHIYKSALFFEYGVFSIETDDGCHHFGIKYDDFWKKDLPFPVERIKEETPYLFFRQALIIIILAYIFWEVVKK